MSSAPTKRRIDGTPGLAARLSQGDRGALSMAITEVENGSRAGNEVVEEVAGATTRNVMVVGITGPPGSGKSTLVGGLVTQLLAKKRRIGVLLVDPSSPVTGGAILADRVRMKHHVRSDDLFVRSLAARGYSGGLSRTTGSIVRLLDGWGADIVIIETVGAGQAEVDICRIADQTIVVCPPGLGDELQAMKAGLMEVADIFVVNKSDRPGAAKVVASLRDAGHGGSRGNVRPVLRTVATTGDGMSDLVKEIEQHVGGSVGNGNDVEDRLGPSVTRHLLAGRVAILARELVFASTAQEVDDIVAGVVSRQLDFESAAHQMLATVTRS